MKVLVVEDCPLAVKEYYDIFRDWDDEVVVTPNPELAYQLIELKELVFDLVVSDLCLRGVSPESAESAGLRLIGCVKAVQPTIPYLLVTDQKRPMEVPETNYLLKGESLRKRLKQKVAEVFRAKQSELQTRLTEAIVVRFCHEVNNPMTVILGTAELLLETYKDSLPERIVLRLDGIVEQAHQLGQVMRRMANLHHSISVSTIGNLAMVDVPPPLIEVPGEQ